MNATESTQGHTSESFVELFGNVPLSQLFADWQPSSIDIEDDAHEWLHFPPARFLAWARDYPRFTFDGVPPAPHHKAWPSFLLSQSHRIWLSASLVTQFAGLEAHLVDLGSYPFAVPLVLRDYLGYEGPITATAIQPLSEEEQSVLRNKGIELAPLDLDPFVRDPAQQHTSLPTSLACETNSCDVVTMFHVIEHLYHPMSILREAQRVLRPGGKLIIATDNAMMLNTLVNYISGYGYTFEPVTTTAAMAFHDWRGHVRFFTPTDLHTMAEAAGFADIQLGFEQVFYDVFHEAYFCDPQPKLAGWEYEVLKDHRQFANEVFLIATKDEP